MASGLLLAGTAHAFENLTHVPVTPAKTARSALSTRAVWTQERIAVLRWMWAEDRSAAYIARQLGRCTRDAVHRKARRLGLKRPRFGPPDQIRRSGSVAEIKAYLRTTTLTSDQNRALINRYRSANCPPLRYEEGASRLLMSVIVSPHKMAFGPRCQNRDGPMRAPGVGQGRPSDHHDCRTFAMLAALGSA